MFQKIVIAIILGAGLTACSSYLKTSYNTEVFPVEAEKVSSQWVKDYLKPYKDSLDADMNQVIAYAETDFVVQRPSSNLTNWFADAVFSEMTKNKRFQDPIFCLFNTGGIRANINKGEVTLGDIFKVMPFDNRLVFVRLPKTVLPEIEAYLRKSGGEPISNAILTDKGLVINGDSDSDYITIITSDYLAAGGDKMTFMNKRVELTETGVLLRDVLIEAASTQGQLIEDTTIRIQL